MKQEKGRSIPALAVELLCCLLGSCAFCAALLPALGQDVGMTDCVLAVAVDLSLIFLLSRRWWLAPALLAALAVLGMGAVWAFRWETPIREYAEGFLEWYNAAYPYTLPYSENGSEFLVHLVFSFPVTLVLYLYFRRFPFLPLWAALSAALLWWMHYTGAEGMLLTAALLLIVLFVLICRTNARSINRKLGQKERIPASSMQVTAMLLAPLVVLFAFALAPKEEGAWQSKGLVHLIQDLRDALSFYGDGSDGGGSFDLGYSGFAPNGFSLGGDIEPDNRTVMRVKTDTPILLAGAVYDAYDGRGWYDGWNVGHFRFGSPLWKGRRREVFTISLPSSRQASVPYGKISRYASLEISLNVKFRALFTGGKVEGLTLRSGDNARVYFNSQGEVYLDDYPDTAVSYTLHTRTFDRSDPNFDWNMRLLLRYASAAKDRDYADILQRFTLMSDTVEPFVRELAEEITAGCEDEYEKALAIEKWLGENCTYTRTPGNVPEGRDFVSWFLETREGYCTYYASAMTILARLAGLPARYVSGYGLKQAELREGTNSYVATNATAHAWCQIYFYGVGWVDFDPTHWNFHELVETDAPKPQTPKPETTPPSVDLPEPDLPEPELPEPEEGGETRTVKKRDDSGKILLIILCADAAAFLIFLLVRFILLFFRVENVYRRLNRRYPDNAARADECYRQILKQLGFLGLEMEPADTMVRFWTRADDALGGRRAEERLASVCEPVLLSRFAMRPPTDGEVRRMCDFYISLEGKLRKTLGLRKYVVHRMILGR